MNKKYTPYFLISVLLLAGAGIWWRTAKQKAATHYNAFYPLQQRQGIAANWPEWAQTSASAERLIRVVRENPDDVKSMVTLAGLYINEGRASGNHDYYDGAALHYLTQVLEKNPKHFEALTMKALVQLSHHRFADALQTAALARTQNPHNAFVHGLLVDSYVELGQYKNAVESADQMVAIRPDMRSYSRVAYLREIHGDPAGALEAMKMAVDAGGVGDEPSSWTRVQLAALYAQDGDMQRAAMHYQKTLDARPNYAFAVAGLGHLALRQRQYPEALRLFLQADTLPSDHGFGEEIARTYLAMGKHDQAAVRLQEMEKGLLEEVDRNKNKRDAPYHTDLELAAVYLLWGRYDQALGYALAEYRRRPENIEVNELVGWLYYKKGAAQTALSYIQKAMRTGCKNEQLLARAGLIFTALGKKAEGVALLQQAIAHGPLGDPLLDDMVRQTLQQRNA